VVNPLPASFAERKKTQKKVGGMKMICIFAPSKITNRFLIGF